MVAAFANFAPEVHARLFQAVRIHDIAAAKIHQEYILRLLEAFVLPAVKESISALAYSVKLAAQRRGWLDCPDVMMPGFKLEEGLRRVMEQLLTTLELPSAPSVVAHQHKPHFIAESCSTMARSKN
jgi:dihydrodipicolinate synthase/N-acetylneuraminate lyase